MGGKSGGGGADKALEYQQQQDRERERRIREGMDYLDAAFEGGRVGRGRVDSFDPGRNYYDRQGNVAYEAGDIDPSARSMSVAEARGAAGEYQQQLDRTRQQRQNTWNTPGSQPTGVAGSFQQNTMTSAGHQPTGFQQPGTTTMGPGEMLMWRDDGTPAYEQMESVADRLHRNAEKASAMNQMHGQMGMMGAQNQLPADEMRRQAEEIEQAAALRRRGAAADRGEMFTDRHSYEGFGNDFYQQRADAYKDYANPQAERQYNDANEQLVYALNRANLGQSSAGNRAMARLGSDYEQAQDDIGRKAQGHADQARQDVARERQNLSNLIQSTADPSMARDQMPGVAEALSSTPQFDSMGQLFGDVTRGIGAYQQGQAFRQAQKNVGNAGYGSDPSSGSGRNVR